MAQAIGILRVIRARSTSTFLASVTPPKLIPPTIQPLNRLLRIFESPTTRSLYLHITKSYASGHTFNMGKLLGVSAVLGSFLLRPRFAHCMDGYAGPADHHSIGMLRESEPDDNPHNFMIFAKKLMVPIALLLIVWMNWNYPVVLGVKVMLALLSTKPSPFSVYVFIDQLQQQYRGRHPILHKFKSLYAKEVEVDDYVVLCIAKVEIGDQKYTLVGILGGWWVFEVTSLRSALSAFRSRALQILETAVSSKV